MAFDANYYADKKKKINERYIKKIEDTIVGMTNALNSFYADKNAMIEELNEINKIEAENKPEPVKVEEVIKSPAKKK